jgi:hypothetical protein
MRWQSFMIACALVLASETHAHSREGGPKKEGRGNRKPEDNEYAVVIDAGSVASTVHIYSFYWKETHAYPHVFLPGKR